MNPMMISMLENYLGKDRANVLLQQWNSMTPQQQQAEMSKVSSMSREEQTQYLSQKGIDVNALMNNVNSQPNSGNNGGGRFNY
ncbi:MAG: hypothetical protein ACRC1T_09285 [Clostridium chrysemydis]|uniref:hypothetical protein n=1 Tax=Clostridium chrysemydis TaxID=2665504 RepID=UPI003F2A4474